ncbi:MAG: efflux transporter outer membrane subunit [Gammaproteobacteria bacterium]|nr:efflux transporter outer membrane subunit [Gammaproteobacteria bacterium]
MPLLPITMRVYQLSISQTLTSRNNLKPRQRLTDPKATTVKSYKFRWRAASTAVFLSLIGGFTVACSAALVPPVSEPVSQLPEEFSGSTVLGAYAPSEWWSAFNDPTLNRIIEAVLASNFDLAEAVARVDQARARERIADSIRSPQVQPVGTAEDTNAPTNAGIGAQVDELDQDFRLQLPERISLTTYTFSIDFSYEVDFWDRNLNKSRVAGAELLASEWDYRAARIGVVAETVRTYLEITHLRRQWELSEEIVEIFREREKLTSFRYNSGVDSARDLYRVRRSLWDAETELPAIEGRLADAEARFWVLLGGFREGLADMLPDTLPSLGVLEPVPAGIPADLLTQRPDVGAARQRMEAARYLVGVRRAELRPSLSLGGTIGLQNSDFENWLHPDQWFRNLTVNLLGPVFQGSRLQQNVTLAEKQWNEAVAAYGRTVVTAVNEVEAALSGWGTSHRFYTLRKSFAEEARAEAEYQERRYQSGVADYEDYLTASQTLVSANSALAAAERDLGYARLALHRALGGTWVTSGSLPPQADDSAQTEGSPSTATSTD